MGHTEVLLGTYPLQKDMRIRLPKQIINNLPIKIGTTFNIYLNPINSEIILRISSELTSKEDISNGKH